MLIAFKSLSYWAWFVVLTLLACVLANVPLFNLLAFEFCTILAFGISFVGAHIAVTAVKRLRDSPQSAKGPPAQLVNVLFWRALGTNLTLLIAPLIIFIPCYARIDFACCIIELWIAKWKNLSFRGKG